MLRLYRSRQGFGDAARLWRGRRVIVWWSRQAHGRRPDARPHCGSAWAIVARHLPFRYLEDPRLKHLRGLIREVMQLQDAAQTLLSELSDQLHAHTNTADDTVHQQTWLTLVQLVGSPDFCYVGDCKLASTENMQFIAGRNGSFISVRPRSRNEVRWMEDYLVDHQVP